MSHEPFTTSYFCLFPKNNSIPLPRTALININIASNKILRNYTLTDKFTTNPDVLKKSAGRQSACYDIQGTVVTNEIFLRMIVYATGGGEFDFIIKTYSAKELIGDNNEKPNYLYVEGNQDAGNAVVQYDMQIKKISAVYKDRLLVDY